LALPPLLICLFFGAAAQGSESKGSAKVSYSGWLKKEHRETAETDALRNALEQWIVKKHKSHYPNYTKSKADFDRNIRDYIIAYTVLDRDQDKKNKVFEVLLRAEINEPKVMSLLLSHSPSASEYMTFVFVAREQVGKVKHSEQESALTKSKTQAIGKSRQDNQASQTKSQTKSIKKTKTETIHKDKVVWDVTTTNEVDVAMGNVFADANYLVIDAAMLEDETGNMLSVENFISDYQAGNDLRPATKKEALRGLKSLEDPVHYLAIGTLDIDEMLTDKTTGNIKVAVSVTGQVLAVHKRGAAVAKVGPETMFGEGPTPMVAKNNALKAAAEAVAEQLVAQLSAKSIR
jgi:hypothetical protein